MRCIYIIREDNRKGSKKTDWVMNNLKISFKELVSKFKGEK